MKFKCAGCFKDIPYNEFDFLCPECIEQICGVKVSYDDQSTDKEKIKVESIKIKKDI